jgi:hypothetical protein
MNFIQEEQQQQDKAWVFMSLPFLTLCNEPISAPPLNFPFAPAL